MSEAADAPAEDFEAEFEAARQAERDDPAPEVNDDDDAEPVEAAEVKEPVETEAEKVTKRLRDTQKALKAERTERQKLNARLEALEKAPTKAEKAPTPAELAAMLRDDDDDPIGQIQTLAKLAKVLVGETEQESQADRVAQQRAQALQSVSNSMKEYEDDFRELTPDYDKAAKHFMDARAEELKDTGLDGNALNLAMQNDFAGIVSRSIAAGKDPAEIIYNMAKRRGFSSTEKPAEAVTKLETIERGQAQSKTLGGGGTSPGSLSMSAVGNLRGAAFDAAFEKLRASERRR